MNGLLDQLCADYLFPAANLMAKQKEDPQFSLTKVPHTQLYFALNARCSTKASRQVGFLFSLKCSAPASPPAFSEQSPAGWSAKNSDNFSSIKAPLGSKQSCASTNLQRRALKPCSSYQCSCRLPLICWLTS